MADQAKPAVETVRVSVSFPKPVYAEMEQIANAHKVSLAWVVREAVEKYLKDRWPLFPSP
jgi:metal-responsive CopG/Arc/MetJ family transcriptional regulator